MCKIFPPFIGASLKNACDVQITLIICICIVVLACIVACAIIVYHRLSLSHQATLEREKREASQKETQRKQIAEYQSKILEMSKCKDDDSETKKEAYIKSLKERITELQGLKSDSSNGN